MFKLGWGGWSDAQSVFKLSIYLSVPKRFGIDFFQLFCVVTVVDINVEKMQKNEDDHIWAVLPTP